MSPISIIINSENPGINLPLFYKYLHVRKKEVFHAFTLYIVFSV